MASKTYLITIEGRQYRVQAEEVINIATLVSGITPTTAEYTGEPITVDLVTDAILTEGVDYYIEYSNNIDVGDCDVLVYGMGAYEGMLEYTLTITPPSNEESNEEEES